MSWREDVPESTLRSALSCLLGCIPVSVMKSPIILSEQGNRRIFLVHFPGNPHDDGNGSEYEHPRYHRKRFTCLQKNRNPKKRNETSTMDPEAGKLKKKAANNPVTTEATATPQEITIACLKLVAS